MIEEDNVQHHPQNLAEDHVFTEMDRLIVEGQSEAEQAWQQGNWEDQNPAIAKLQKAEKIIVFLLICCTLFHMIGNAFIWNFSPWPAYSYLSIGALIIWIIVIASLLVQWNQTKIAGIRRTKFIFVSPQIALIGTLIWALGYVLLFACSDDLVGSPSFYVDSYDFLYYSQMLVAFFSGFLWVAAIISVQYQQRDGYYQIP